MKSLHPESLPFRFRCLLLGLAIGALANPVPAQAQQRAEQEAAKTILPLSDALMERCVTILRDGMRSDEFWPSIHAAEGLTLAGHGDEVQQYLAPKLDSEQDDQRRCGLARELVRSGDRGKSTIMSQILAGEEPHGHVHAAESLYKVGEIGDGQAMRAAFAQEENITLRLMAAAALGKSGSLPALTSLRNYLTDDDPDTRRIAAWILGRIGDAVDIPQLRENAATAKDPLVRCYNEHALAALGDAEGLAALARNLKDDDPAIRTYAATFAGDTLAVSTANRLVELLDDENLDVRVRSAQTLAVLSRHAAQPNENTGDDISVLVYPATKEHPRNTEGAVMPLHDGSLLYAVSQFVGGGSDFSRARIVACRSQDGGRTWSDSKTLQESTGKLNVMSVSLVRLAPPHEDTVAMFYLEKNGFDDLRVYVRFSRDECQTFGEPIRVTTESGYHVMNNDRVRQLSSGRLLAPVASSADVRKENHFVSHCWLSDDGGQSWRKGKQSVDLPKRGAMEPEVIELQDGRVMMIMRTQLGYIATAYSSDGGDTWSEPGRLSVQAPEAPATLRRIPATGHLLLIWNNTFTAGVGHGGKRTPLTAATSKDEGKTWQHIRDLETDPDKTYAYTSLAFDRGRALMSYWESAAAGGLASRFRSLPVVWFYESANDEGR